MSRSYNKSLKVYCSDIHRYEHPRSQKDIDDAEWWLNYYNCSLGRYKAHANYWRINAPKHFRKLLNRSLRAKQKAALDYAVRVEEDYEALIPQFVHDANWLWW